MTGRLRMINHLRSMRRTARFAGWAMAYALVLQLVLSSVVFAGLVRPAADGQPQICYGAGSPSSPGEADGAGVVHCALCLSRVDVAGLVPPPVVFDVTRYATPVRYVARAAEPPRGVGARLSHQPRAPPGCVSAASLSPLA